MKTAAAAVALAALALFSLEPFVGKVLLPRLGGTPMVWNTCVMAFQALLLAGYAYSVWLSRMAPGRALRIHATASAVAVLGWWLGLRVLWSPPGLSSPVLQITSSILFGVGVPFVVLSATSPLIQVWMARARNVNVHRLYAISNVASVLGLVLYVGGLEPLVGLRAQSVVIWLLLLATSLVSAHVFYWQGLRAVDAATPVANQDLAASAAVSEAAPSAQSAISVVSRADRFAWIARSAVASLCLYAVNTYLATDVASFPLLFVIPLAIFLLAFAGGFSAWAERWRGTVQVVGIAAACGALYYLLRVANAWSSPLDLPMPLVALAGVVLALASTLSHSRPADRDLPDFYTMIGVGGLLAGVVAVLIVPWGWTRLAAPFHHTNLWLVDAAVPEYPIALILGMAFIPRRWWPRVVAVAAAVMLVTSQAETYGMATIYQARNFYGTLRVQNDPSSSTHRLKNGTTMHGFEVTSDPDRRPTSYYHPESPIGQLMTRVHPHLVTAFGLGTGTLAAYAGRSDEYQFLEINPLVAEIAGDPDYFSYVTRARKRGASVDIHLGDGRLLAAALPDHSADLIVLDAFSSDSIPVHLVTREAFEGYRRLLAPGGLVAVHVSNRFFDLGPSVAATAEASGWRWSIQSRTIEATDESASTWVALVLDERAAARWGIANTPWEHFGIPKGVSAWTDDWANLLGRLRPVAEKMKTTFN